MLAMVCAIYCDILNSLTMSPNAIIGYVPCENNFSVKQRRVMHPGLMRSWHGSLYLSPLASNLPTDASSCSMARWPVLLAAGTTDRLRAATDNLDLVRRDDLAAAVHLELDVSNQEGPHIVAETVGIE